MTLYPGDHLISGRGLYAHHGIVSAVQPSVKVIHYAGLSEGLRKGPVTETSLTAFCSGNTFRVKQYRQRAFDGPASVRRAQARLGEVQYDVLTNNCEHFVTWCIEGASRSGQITRRTLGIVHGARGAVLVALRYGVSGFALAPIGLAGGLAVGLIGVFVLESFWELGPE